MAEPPRYVVDASVVAKWHPRDEEFVEPAVALLLAFQEDRVALLAPAHIAYEVPSAIRNAVRGKRLDPADGRAAITEFLALGIATVDDHGLIVAGYEQALRFGCSLYDGLYLALAEAARCPFIYADKHLRNALGNRFALALWIEEYRLTGAPSDS